MPPPSKQTSMDSRELDLGVVESKEEAEEGSLINLRLKLQIKRKQIGSKPEKKFLLLKNHNNLLKVVLLKSPRTVTCMWPVSIVVR